MEDLTNKKKKESSSKNTKVTFQTPKTWEKLEAIDYELDEESKNTLTFNMKNDYKDIAYPKRDNWLSKYGNEETQTYKDFLTIMNKSIKEKNTIFLLNLDNGLNNLENSYINDGLFKNFILLIQLYYPGVKAQILEGNHNLETLQITKRSHDNAYDSVDVLRKISKIKPSNGMLIMGITSYDLFQKSFDHVYGLANLQTNSGVISFKRFWEHFSKIKNISVIDSVIKLGGQTLLHEIGHIFGMNHCVYFNCNMNGSNGIEEALSQSFELCPVCLRKMFGMLNFDILNRFENLIEGLIKINKILYAKEISWFKKRVCTLKLTDSSGDILKSDDIEIDKDRLKEDFDKFNLIQNNKTNSISSKSNKQITLTENNYMKDNKAILVKDVIVDKSKKDKKGKSNKNKLNKKFDKLKAEHYINNNF